MRRLLLVQALLTIAASSSGCSSEPVQPSPAPRPALFDRPGAMLSLERIERPEYDHPIPLDPERLAKILEKVEYDEWIHDRRTEPRPVFATGEILLMKEPIARGLAAAGRDERLAFRLDSNGLRTDGVLFVRGGDLHVVLANCALRPGDGPRSRVREGDPTRLEPPGDWRLVAGEGQRLGRLAPTRPLGHWLVIDLARSDP